MNRKQWRQLDGETRRAQNLECYKDMGVCYIAPTRGRDRGRRDGSQETRIDRFRREALRDLRIPDRTPDPALEAIMASLGRSLYVHNRAGTLRRYRQNLRATLANSGFACLWMIERALACGRACDGAVRAMERAA